MSLSKYTERCVPEFVVPEPTPLPPCPESENCSEIIQSDCVRMSADIPTLNITKGQKLTSVFVNFAANQSTQAIAVQDSFSVDLSGTGLNTDPVKADVKLSADTGNMLTVETDGLKAVMTREAVLQMFTLIANDPELQILFCELVGNCGDQVCGIISGISGEPQP
jgi:hypothetical protein